MTTPATPSLFDTLALNGVPLRNRLAVAPMTRISATAAGVPTEAMTRYYAGFARGGFGLIVTEGIYTDRAYAQGYAGQPGLTDAQQVAAWRQVVAAVHQQGGRIVAQLMHAGALSQANRFRDDTVGPSAVQPKGQQMAVYAGKGPYRMPRAMEEADVLQAIEGFAQAARLARDAGFDGVKSTAPMAICLISSLRLYESTPGRLGRQHRAAPAPAAGNCPRGARCRGCGLPRRRAHLARQGERFRPQVAGSAEARPPFSLRSQRAPWTTST